MNAPAQSPSLTVRQEVAASPRELFDAWLDPDKLAKWMRPGDTNRASRRIPASAANSRS